MKVYGVVQFPGFVVVESFMVEEEQALIKNTIECLASQRDTHEKCFAEYIVLLPMWWLFQSIKGISKRFTLDRVFFLSRGKWWVRLTRH